MVERTMKCLFNIVTPTRPLGRFNDSLNCCRETRRQSKL